MARMAKGFQQPLALVVSRNGQGIHAGLLPVHGNAHFYHHPGLFGGGFRHQPGNGTVFRHHCIFL